VSVKLSSGTWQLAHERSFPAPGKGRLKSSSPVSLLRSCVELFAESSLLQALIPAITLMALTTRHEPARAPKRLDDLFPVGSMITA
jgi:hypothetical protein